MYALLTSFFRRNSSNIYVYSLVCLQAIKPSTYIFHLDSHIGSNENSSYPSLLTHCIFQIAGIALNGISRRGEVEEALKSMGNVENIQYHHIFGLLFNLNKEADLFNKYGIDEIFELRILCVSPKYRGRGIASKLFAASEKIAVERGFKVSCLQIKGRYSNCNIRKLH